MPPDTTPEPRSHPPGTDATPPPPEGLGGPPSASGGDMGYGLVRACAWCRMLMDPIPVRPTGVTHGICLTCRDGFMAEKVKLDRAVMDGLLRDALGG